MKKQFIILIASVFMAGTASAQMQTQTTSSTPSRTQTTTTTTTEQNSAITQPVGDQKAQAEMKKTTEESQKKQIDQQYKTAKSKCNNLEDNGKDICEAEAEGLKKIAQAQMEVTQRDTPKSRLKLAETKAEAEYKVAKEKCDDQVGDLKKACTQEAKAARDSALATAKADSQKKGDTNSNQSSAFETKTPQSSQEASGARQPSSIIIDQPSESSTFPTGEPANIQQGAPTQMESENRD